MDDSKSIAIFSGIKDIIKLLYTHDSKLPNISLFFKLCFSVKTANNKKIQETMIQSFKTTLQGKEDVFVNNDVKEAAKFVVNYNQNIFFHFEHIFLCVSLPETDKINLLNRLAYLYYLFFGSEKIKTKLVNKKETMADKLLNVAEGLSENKNLSSNPMLALSSIMSSGLFSELENEGDDGMDKIVDMAQNLLGAIKQNRQSGNNNMTKEDLRKIMMKDSSK